MLSYLKLVTIQGTPLLCLFSSCLSAVTLFTHQMAPEVAFPAGCACSSAHLYSITKLSWGLRGADCRHFFARVLEHKLRRAWGTTTGCVPLEVSLCNHLCFLLVLRCLLLMKPCILLLKTLFWLPTPRDTVDITHWLPVSHLHLLSWIPSNSWIFQPAVGPLLCHPRCLNLPVHPPSRHPHFHTENPQPSRPLESRLPAIGRQYPKPAIYSLSAEVSHYKYDLSRILLSLRFPTIV